VVIFRSGSGQYTESCVLTDRKRLAQDAIAVLANETATSIPSPSDSEGGKAKKENEIRFLIFRWWAVTL
jgi:hypothetical protein